MNIFNRSRRETQSVLSDDSKSTNKLDAICLSSGRDFSSRSNDVKFVDLQYSILASPRDTSIVTINMYANKLNWKHTCNEIDVPRYRVTPFLKTFFSAADHFDRISRNLRCVCFAVSTTRCSHGINDHIDVFKSQSTLRDRTTAKIWPIHTASFSAVILWCSKRFSYSCLRDSHWTHSSWVGINSIWNTHRSHWEQTHLILSHWVLRKELRNDIINCKRSAWLAQDSALTCRALHVCITGWSVSLIFHCDVIRSNTCRLAASDDSTHPAQKEWPHCSVRVFTISSKQIGQENSLLMLDTRITFEGLYLFDRR